MPRHIAMGNLSLGMHTSIRATSGGNRMGAGFQLGQCRLYRSLHRWLVILTLPAGKRRTVIFNKKGIAWHIRGLGAGGGEINPYTIRLGIPILEPNG